MFWYNIATSAVFAAVSCYVFLASSRFPAPLSGGVGPGYWPSFLACLLFALSVTLFVEALWRRSREKRAEESSPTGSRVIDFSSPGMRRIYAVCGIFVVFAILLGTVGFLAGTVFFIPCCMYLLGERRLHMLALFAVCVPAAVYGIFSALLGIELP